MQHGDGEILAARAANAAGIPYTLSTMSICSIEDVAEATGKPFWFQLYVIHDRGFSKEFSNARWRRNATRWCSPSICRCSASATRTCATA